ncbi:uncharacterized protein LOC141630958 [Silene latifolia]|uniref:uncharacterized protein LOC141630958 n=1 Tax=Silene latifolia TaxID=37657 RepID=UPI003D76A844
MIVAVFTGQLKGWWDNYLSEDERQAMYNTVKIENGVTLHQAVYTLVINIVDHFTGQYANKQESTRTLLHNQRCKSLTDFRWYKDTFLSRVMILPETNSSHWKAKFIDGLPHLFAERVRKTLRGNEASIYYEHYNYGQLIKICTQEGLNLCNEIKLNQQLKHQNLVEKHQLGEFCEQFDMDMPSSSKKKKKNNIDHNYHKYKKMKYSKKKLEDKSQRKFQRQQYKKNYRKKGYTPSKQIRCFKCNKKGHMTNDCWTQQQINNLEIDDDLKDKLSKLFLDDNELNRKTEGSSSSSSNDNIKIIDNDSDTSESSMSECTPCVMGKPCTSPI